MNKGTTFVEGSQRTISLEKTNIDDPSEIRTKGCGKRFPSYKEKTASKSRICRGCGQHGVSHDK